MRPLCASPVCSSLFGLREDRLATMLAIEPFVEGIIRHRALSLEAPRTSGGDAREQPKQIYRLSSMTPRTLRFMRKEGKVAVATEVPATHRGATQAVGTRWVTLRGQLARWFVPGEDYWCYGVMCFRSTWLSLCAVGRLHSRSSKVANEERLARLPTELTGSPPGGTPAEFTISRGAAWRRRWPSYGQVHFCNSGVHRRD